MSPQAAQLVVIVGVVFGVVLWLCALMVYARMRASSVRLSKRLGPTRLAAPEAIDKLLQVMATRARVTERTENSLRLAVGKAEVNLRLDRDVGGTVLHAEVDVTPATAPLLLTMGVFVFLVEPAAIVLAGVLLSTFVVSCPDPAVRWQSVQVVQISHFLWPPFLIWFVHRRVRTALLLLAEEAGALVCGNG